MIGKFIFLVITSFRFEFLSVKKSKFYFYLNACVFNHVLAHFIELDFKKLCFEDHKISQNFMKTN